MNYSKVLPTMLTAVVCLAAAPTDVFAQPRGHGGGGHVAAGRAVPRGYAGAPRVYAPYRYYGHVYRPYVVGYAPYRPYYYPYRAGFTVGFYAGFGYPYGYPYYGYYPYGASAYYGYGYPYGYGPYYNYPLPPAGYMSMRPGVAYGGVRIQGAPPDGRVFVDGYYVGVVDDFDGPFQHLNLEPGVHKIEIRMGDEPGVAFDVNVQPGQTITYHAGMIR